MSLSNDEDYKKKALKYFTKYTQLKLSLTNLKGGSIPIWYNDLVKESQSIYRSLSIISSLTGEPKNSIMLSGSAALALYLGNENMDVELNEIFSGDYKSPGDLDFIYQGSNKNDNLNIPSVQIRYNTDLPITFTRTQETAISSPEYIIDPFYQSLDKPLIKKFDLTNVNPYQKEISFTKLPYITIYGIKVVTPEKLLSFYNDDFLEKNITKVEILTNFIDRMKSDKIKEQLYCPVFKDNKYNPSTTTTLVPTRPISRLLEDDDSPPRLPKGRDLGPPLKKPAFSLD